MKLLNVHMSADGSEAERFDTLVSPSGTVATLNQIAQINGVEAMGFDTAFPDSENVQNAVRTEINRALKEGETPMILFTLLVYNAQSSLRFIESLKRDFSRKIITVIGGQLVPFAREAYLRNPYIDITCEGDGEVLIPTLIKDTQHNRLKTYYSQWLSKHLDLSRRGKFEFVSYDNFYKIRERLEAQKTISGFSQLCIQGLGGPGCSWAANNRDGACDFCALQNIQEMNTRSIPELMQAESELEEKFSPDRLFDVANQFLPYLNKKKNIAWLRQYIAERKRLGLRATKYAYLTVGSIDEDIASLLREAGIEEVYLGVDHFHPVSLKEENKSHRSQQRLKRTLDALVENGIKFRIGVVLGSASETDDSLQSVREGVHWLKDNYVGHLNALGVFPIYVLPGSGVYEKVRKMNDVQPIIQSFEGKGYFTWEEEAALTRQYIQQHSQVHPDNVLETANSIQALMSEATIAYDYKQSPGADSLRK